MTFQHDLRSFPQPVAESVGDQRFYVTPEGKRYPSVTTVVGFKKNAFFADWRAKNPEEAKRVTERGSLLHAAMEDHIMNRPVSFAGLPLQHRFVVEDMFLRMKRLVTPQILGPVLALETALYSDLLQLAGRCDCIARYEGRRAILDFKGATRFKAKEDIENYFMQGAAYAVAWEERTKMKVDTIVIFIVAEDGSGKPYVVKVKDWIKPLMATIDEWRKQ